MRRPELGFQTRRVLHAESRLIADGREPREEWNRFRGLVASRPVVAALEQMAAPLGRCAYCSDSLGADIDHYIPMAKKPSLAFDWANMFWVCNNCNRRKSNLLKYDESTGLPLLLRPDKDFVWDHLYLDTETGVVTERYDARSCALDAKAQETLKVLKVLTFEAVVESRKAVCRQLSHLGESYLQAESGRHEAALIRAFKEEVHGVSSWITRSDGRFERNWWDLRNRNARLWRRLTAIACS